MGALHLFGACAIVSGLRFVAAVLLTVADGWLC